MQEARPWQLAKPHSVEKRRGRRSGGLVKSRLTLVSLQVACASSIETCLVVLHVSLDITTNTSGVRRLHALVASMCTSGKFGGKDLRHEWIQASVGNFKKPVRAATSLLSNDEELVTHTHHR